MRSQGEALIPLENIFAQAQLLVFREQIDPTDPTLSEEIRALLYTLCPHVKEAHETNARLCGIIDDLCEEIRRLSFALHQGVRNV